MNKFEKVRNLLSCIKSMKEAHADNTTIIFSDFFSDQELNEAIKILNYQIENKEQTFNHQEIYKMVRSDIKLVGDGIIEMPVGQVRELQLYLEETYGVHMVLQVSELPTNHGPATGGYAAAAS